MNSPFKFLDAYEKKDKEIFFGRDKDIELLYETTFKTDLLLVYGQSGTGKTSLIQCGLANRFRDTDWFDLYIRRRDNINISLKQKLREKAQTPIEENTGINEAIQSLYLDYLKPIYLIFDQFEELFILGSKEEQQQFFQTIAQLLKAPDQKGQKRVSCKILFVMREEYIAWLYDFEKVVSELFDYRIRVEPMNLANVEEVITGSAKAFAIRLDSPDETVVHIIDNNKDQKGIIHLPYLQVYLDRLYREAARTNQPGVRSESPGGPGDNILFTPGLVNKVGKISDVMAVFLDEQTRQIQQYLRTEYPKAPADLVWQVLNRFVTLEGTNAPMAKEMLYSTLSQPEEIIDFCLSQLEDARILHVSKQDSTYEIAHDALARCIDEKRSVEEKTLLKIEKLVKSRFADYEATASLLTKGELNYIEPYEEKLKLKLETDEINFIVKSRKKVSKQKRAIIIFTIVFIIILSSITIFAFINLNKAEKAKVNLLLALAEVKVTEDPTIALRIAEKAWELDKKNKTVTGTIDKIYRENNFYKTMFKQERDISIVAFSPDGKYIVTGTWDATAHLWDRQGKKLKDYTGHTNAVSSMAFSPDVKYILTGSWDRTARLWNLQGMLLQVFKGHKDGITSVAFSPDSKYILTGSIDKTARLWHLQGMLLQVFKGHESTVCSVAFSPGGNYVLTGSEDKTARLWDRKTGKEKVVFTGEKDKESIYCAAFSPDGEFILTGADFSARLWDRQGKQKKVFKLKRHGFWIQSIAFSPDGNYILTGSGDKTARLWDRETEKQLQVFTGHTSTVFTVAFSRDGKSILTGSDDDTVRLWKIGEKTMPWQEFLKTGGNIQQLSDEQKKEFQIKD